VSQGEGWWQASDGKWSAPELRPDSTPGAAEPEPTLTTEQPVPPAAPVEPLGSGGGGRGKVIVAVLIVLALIGAGVAIALTRDDDNDKSATKTDQSTSSGGSSSSSSKSSGSTKSSDSETDALLAKAKKALIVGSDIGSGFDGTTPVTEEGSFPCNGKRYDDAAKAVGKEETELDRGNDLAVVERIRVYSSDDDAQAAIDAATPGYTCRTGTVHTSTGSFAVTILSMATPFGGDGTDDDVSAAVRVDSDDSGSSGLPSNLHQNSAGPTTSSSATPLFNFLVFAARVGQTVLVFEFYVVPGADTTGLPSTLDIVKDAIKKFTG
jgi:hypothetical protein